MKTTKLLLNILIILLFMVGLWLGYRFFFSSPAEPAPSVGLDSESEDTLVPTGPGSEFIILLNRLKEVTLDSSFLANPIFTTDLENFSTALPARSYGRRNPFATFGTGNVGPDGGDNSSTSTSAVLPTDLVASSTISDGE